jgi:hypothetical protein
MDLDRGDFKLIVYGAVLLLFLGVNVVRWIANRRAQARGEKPGGPPPEEPASGEPPSEGPKLPYEDLVDQVFGPYIRQRRREHEEAKVRERAEAVEVIEVVEEPAPPPPRPKPPPAAPPREEKPAPPVAVAAPPVPAPVRLSLDERIFRNPRWSAAAKLVVAGEILARPKTFRPHGAKR